MTYARIFPPALRKLLLLPVLAYAVVVLVLYVFQRDVLYHPNVVMGPPEDEGLRNFSRVTLTTEDGVRLVAWAHAAGRGKPTVVYFHGNGGNLADRVALLRALAENGYGVLGLSYRGYGGSTGTPSEQGLYADARAAIAHVHERMGVPPQRIYLCAESLGTGIAVRMAAERSLGGILLESPYTSVAQRAQEIYPYLPARLLSKDRYESIRLVGAIGMPLVIVHGDADEVVPIAHGEALFAVAKEPKAFVRLPGVGHYAIPDANVLDALRRLIAMGENAR